MVQKLYVSNLPFSATEDEIRSLFGEFGEVESVNLITDRETGRPRGFGFVVMENASAARDALDGQDFSGRNLRVDNAKERAR